VSLAALVASGTAHADVSGQIEPTYSTASTTSTDAAGETTHTSASQLTQRYRLALDKQLYPLLRLNLGGSYDWTIGTFSTDTTSGDLEQRQWTGSARLSLGGPVLSGAIGYDRRDESSEQRSAGQTVRAPGLVREVYSAFAGWRPADLPLLDLRIVRTNTSDQLRQTVDQTVDELGLSAIYSPSTPLELRYTLQYTNPNDRIHHVDISDVLNTGRISWTDSFLERRLSTFASYSISNRATSGGSLPTVQSPTAGLSGLETFPATVEHITLTANAALVNGDTTASAGIDLGFSRTLAGDTVAREMGAQFGNEVTPVNTIYVWVDRQLPPDVAAGVHFTVYQSRDNVTWAPVNTVVPTGGVVPILFSPVQNRFEITIEQTAALYLKVVAAPLLGTITTDQRFANILVTELQFLLVPTAAASRASTSVTTGAFVGTAKYIVLRTLNLTYDASLFLTHASGPAGRETYTLVNGLSMSKRLSRTLAMSARVDRSDSAQGNGHESADRFSASLSAEPLPTVGATLTYAAQLSERAAGRSFTNGFTLFDRADLYQGVTLSSNASYNFGTNEVSQTTTTVLAGVSASITPNRVVALSGGYAYSLNSLSGGGRASVNDSSQRVDGNLTFSPFSALYLSAGVSRNIGGSLPPSTLANFVVNAAPFPYGDLLVRVAYSESLDTSSQTRTRAFGPGARWNIRRGAVLDLAYNLNETHTPAQDTTLRGLFVNLFIAL
jgi:hypothetical protein